jgi:hypothetical protein
MIHYPPLFNKLLCLNEFHLYPVKGEYKFILTWRGVRIDLKWNFHSFYLCTCMCTHFPLISGTRCEGDYFQEKEKEELPKNQRASSGVFGINCLNVLFYNKLLILILLDGWLSFSGVDKVKDN